MAWYFPEGPGLNGIISTGKLVTERQLLIKTLVLYVYASLQNRVRDYVWTWGLDLIFFWNQELEGYPTIRFFVSVETPLKGLGTRPVRA